MAIQASNLGFQRLGEESRTTRIAKFLILIGSDRAAEIISKLEPEQVEAITREISTIPHIKNEEAESILREFSGLLRGQYAYGGVSMGGAEAARRILYGAFGPKQGELLFKKSITQRDEQAFDFLEDLNTEQVVILLREESPGTQAMILSRLSPKASAKILASLKNKVDVAMRIAKGGSVSPGVLETVSKALKEKARKLGTEKGTAGEKVDGLGTLASILRYSEVSFGDKLLRDMEWENPSLGESLKERLYTPDDIPKMENRALQERLKKMTERNIALLMRGRKEAFKDKILTNVSSVRRTLILEEDELLGMVSRREVEPVLQDFMNWFREGREHGKIMMNDDEDVVI
jgi:flagellar motor switch protein FliG